MRERSTRRAAGSACAALGLALVVAAPSLWAGQPPPVDAAPGPAASANATQADALFQEGKRLFEAGNLGEACARFAQSDALDPTVSTLGLLARCHEQQGLLATAWKEYATTAKRADAAGDSRAAFAKERVSALEPRVPKLMVSLTDPAPGIEVLRNLEPVPAEQIGAEVPVDPGAYAIVVRAPGRQEFQTTILLKEGSRTAITVASLKPIEVKPIAPLPEPTRETGNPRLPAALIAGGLGLVGVGFGAAFGFSASTQNTASNTLSSLCHSNTRQGCSEGRQLRDSAFTASTVSTIGFGAGAVGLGVGLVLLLLPNKPRAERPAAAGMQVTPVVGPSGGGAAWVGRF